MRKGGRGSPTCDVFSFDARAVAAVRRRGLRGREAAALADLFRILGERGRLRILRALSLRELCVCDLSVALGMKVSAVSHQLRLLRGARLVRSRRAGRFVYYALDDRHVGRLFAAGLDHVRHG